MTQWAESLTRLVHLSVRQVKCRRCSGSGQAEFHTQAHEPIHVCESCGGNDWIIEQSRQQALPQRSICAETA